MMGFGEYIGNWGNSGQFCHPNQPQRGCRMLVANTKRSSKSLQTLHRAWVCLALVALCLQAPSLTVHHSHAGGSHAHHHGINHQQGFSPFHADQPVHADEPDDLNLPHSHRLIWGFDFHQPAGPQPVNSPPEPSVPAASIAAIMAPAMHAIENPCPIFSVAPSWPLPVRMAQGGRDGPAQFIPLHSGPTRRCLIIRI